MTAVLPAVRLGRCGLSATRIGLGLAALGRPSYLNLGHAADLGPDRSVDALRARTFGVLDAALAAGVRSFDAARSYGLAEDFLGGWLRTRGIPAGALTISSKWGYRYTAGWADHPETHEVKELTGAMLRHQLVETRQRLGEHLSLYQIHSATLGSGVLDDRDVLDQLAELRASGVAIGLSTSGAGQAETIDAAVATGAFDTVQATWNLHERSAGPALARAHAAGLGVIVKEALANGRLVGAAAPAALRAAAAQRGTTPDALALAAVLAQDWADVVLSGASTVPMLRSNLAALAVDDAADLPEALAEPPDAYWATRAALPWT